MSSVSAEGSRPRSASSLSVACAGLPSCVFWASAGRPLPTTTSAAAYGAYHMRARLVPCRHVFTRAQCRRVCLGVGTHAWQTAQQCSDHFTYHRRRRHQDNNWRQLLVAQREARSRIHDFSSSQVLQQAGLAVRPGACAMEPLAFQQLGIANVDAASTAWHARPPPGDAPHLG